MIVVMKGGSAPEQVDAVVHELGKMGFRTHVSHGVERTLVGAIGDKTGFSADHILRLDGVLEIVPIRRPYKLVSREAHPPDTIVRVGSLEIGGPDKLHVMAGPCSVESREQLMETAEAVKQAGATILRGGAFKPRTSPYAFQGLGEEALRYLAEARERFGMPIITEVMDSEDVPVVSHYADILQIGARNMQNFTLLRKVARTGKPIMLKRGPSATIEEFLLAAEYILSEGNRDVLLCERGLRGVEQTFMRNTLDIAAVPVIKRESHLPVIVDPSHGTGKWYLVAPLAKAGMVAGADGLMVEVHPRPAEALSDGPQALLPGTFDRLMAELRAITQALAAAGGSDALTGRPAVQA
ncbi:MAG: 3-deoxy-7-phosphoheptulonate synthase [Candidatus Sericytochromatia bacterium]|nr:3-deoxy-7-phosphoheptulonate synthase [Candidatus Tanganyikabacteria bacterium]